jgi:hypothetical protein
MNFSLFELGSLHCRALYICYIPNEVSSKVHDQKGGDVDDSVVVVNWTEPSSSSEPLTRKMHYTPDCSKVLNRSGDILVPFPSLEIINMMNYQISFAKLSEPRSSLAVKLKFITWAIPSNWDDSFPNTNLSEMSLRWKDDWPSNLSVPIVEKLLPSLLVDYPLQHNSTIILKILDGFMVSATLFILDVNNLSIFRC